MRTEATAQFAASHMALGYKLPSMTALHKNGASQFGVLMGILERKAGDIAAAVPAAIASVRVPTFQRKGQKAGTTQHRWELQEAFSPFPYARAT